MTISAWGAALRIAHRDAWRARGRSALIMLLVGVPIFVLAAADVLYRTWQLSPAQHVTRTIGAADARVQWVGGFHVDQTPDPDNGGFGSSGTLSRQPAPTVQDLLSDLPAGSRAIEIDRDTSRLTFYTPAGVATSAVTGLDYRDPLAAGIYDQTAGRAPRSADEIALTTALAADTGLDVGDTVRMPGSHRALHVVGLVREPTDQQAAEIVRLPSGTPAPRSVFGTGGSSPSWLIDTPGPVTWAQVLALNNLGYITLSRHVVVDPPPASQVPMEAGTSGAVSGHAIAAGTLVGGMVVLELILLAGPAFAVGARRRRRELGLVAAIGGTRRDLRRIVLADALTLGVSAGLLAVVAGIGAAAAAEPVVERFTTALPGPFEVPWLELGALVLVSLATAVLAALVPAIRAARADVVAALTGLRGIVRTPVVFPAVGAVLVALGAVVAVGASSATSVLLGVLLAEAGLVATTPTLVGAVARLARWLPVSGRIALRDADRTRSAVAPAVAAVMATVLGATAAAIAATSSDVHRRQFWQPSLPQRDTYISLGRHTDDLAAASSALRTTLPDASVSTVRAPSGLCTATSLGTSECTTITVQLAHASTRSIEGDLPLVLVDDGRTVDDLLGTSAPEAAAALRAGHIVVPASAGTYPATVVAALQVVTPGTSAPPDRRLTITAVGIDHGFPGVTAIVPASVATRLGLGVATTGVLAATDTAITATQRQELAAAIARTGDNLGVDTENGYSSPDGWVPWALVGIAALVAVFAALIATALANAESRSDLVLLGTIGASPRTRRVLSFARAAVIAGIGSVLGAAAGLLPARAWVSGIHAPVTVPWGAIIAAVVGIPLVAASLAFVCTRARLPSERAA